MRTWGLCGIVAVCCLSILGCKKSDTDRLEKIGKISKKRALRTLSDLERDHLSGLPKGLCYFRNDTAYKVQQRLKGDRELHKYDIEVTGEGNTVMLKGRVQTDTQRLRAKTIALETVDVKEVKNGLKLASEVEEK